MQEKQRPDDWNGFALTKRQKRATWGRLLVAAMLFSIAFGAGLYLITPNGGYDIGPGTPSHDVHTYAWFFQRGPGYLGIIEGAIFLGPMMTGFFTLAAASITAVQLVLSAQFAERTRRFLRFPLLLFLLLAVIAGLLAGIGTTLATGTTPGICC